MPNHHARYPEGADAGSAARIARNRLCAVDQAQADVGKKSACTTKNARASNYSSATYPPLPTTSCVHKYGDRGHMIAFDLLTASAWEANPLAVIHDSFSESLAVLRLRLRAVCWPERALEEAVRRGRREARWAWPSTYNICV